jgi:hypothetical protein
MLTPHRLAAAALLLAMSARPSVAQPMPCSDLPETGMERPRHVALSGSDEFGGHYVVTYTSFLAFTSSDPTADCSPLYWYSDVAVHYNLTTPRYLWGLDFSSLWREAEGGYPTGPGIGPASRIRAFAVGRGTLGAEWVVGWDPASTALLETGSDEPVFGEFGWEIPGPGSVSLQLAPEPATVALIAGGLLVLAAYASRQRSQGTRQRASTS